ncbi:hypothetical protein DFP95_11049 [Cohnella lupini]|uniref:Uncharacterized protein n=1 Tax=Cohnella lupini TaxID=1294267 RepID=A0A3D9I8T4_9BACL|nr:hypothetical protein DFP95_11049 [Cohnella lupini]
MQIRMIPHYIELNNASRRACCDAIIRNKRFNDAPETNDAAIPDLRTGQNGNFIAKPNVIAYIYGLARI